MADPKAIYETKTESDLIWMIRVNQKRLVLVGSNSPEGTWKIEDLDEIELSTGTINLNEQGMAGVNGEPFTAMDEAAEVLAAKIF